MHDSSVLVFDFPPYHIRRKLSGPYWRNFNLDVWHDEPGDTAIEVSIPLTDVHPPEAS